MVAGEAAVDMGEGEVVEVAVEVMLAAVVLLDADGDVPADEFLEFDAGMGGEQLQAQMEGFGQGGVGAEGIQCGIGLLGVGEGGEYLNRSLVPTKSMGYLLTDSSRTFPTFLKFSQFEFVGSLLSCRFF